MTVEQLQGMDFNELENLALSVKVRIAKHYAGNKIPMTEFFQLKGIEAIYNLRSWKEGKAQGPIQLNKQAAKLAK